MLDPARALAQDHYLLADQASIGLDIGRLRIDVEEFLVDVGHGRRLRDRGASAEAARLLTRAVAAYRADVFEDEPYPDWSSALREEARAAYLAALRMLAEAHRSLGDPGAAVAHLLRLLTIDPYDESAHRALIDTLTAAGQHGEARRAQARYREAMRAIGYVRRINTRSRYTSCKCSRPNRWRPRVSSGPPTLPSWRSSWH